MLRNQWLEVISPIALPHVLNEIIVSFIGNVWLFSRQMYYRNVIGIVDGDVYFFFNNRTFCNDTCIFPDFQAHSIRRIRGNLLLVLLNPYTWGHAGFYIYDKQTTNLQYYSFPDIGCIEIYDGNVYWISNYLWTFDPETKTAHPFSNTSSVSKMVCYGNDLLLQYPMSKRMYGTQKIYEQQTVWVHRYDNDFTIMHRRHIEHNNKIYPIDSVAWSVHSHGPLCILHSDTFYIWDSRSHEMQKMDDSGGCFFTDTDDLYRYSQNMVYKVVLDR